MKLSCPGLSQEQAAGPAAVAAATEWAIAAPMAIAASLVNKRCIGRVAALWTLSEWKPTTVWQVRYPGGRTCAGGPGHAGAYFGGAALISSRF